MTNEVAPGYPLEDYEIVAESEGLRVVVLTIGPDQCVPWHLHTEIADRFFCLQGPMVVETQGPDDSHELNAGERLTVPAGCPHRVSAKDNGRCQFAIVQGVGEYDFVPLD